METGNTILSISAGRFARSTVICSSSPSPPPVRLSPVCRTAPSGVARLLKNTKCFSDKALPSVPSAIALASRSNSSPLVVRSSQPSPTVTALKPGASLVSETLPPLLRLTPIFFLLGTRRTIDNACVPPGNVIGDRYHPVAGNGRRVTGHRIVTTGYRKPVDPPCGTVVLLSCL